VQSVLGLHHLTAIAGNPQKNYDFYSGILGLRLVKKTVNFDDPFTYHLYYGDYSGSPGTILTFFPWSENAKRGKKGSGQITAIPFSINSDSIDFWTERLKKFNIEFYGPYKRLNEEVISFEDHDGFEIELVASGNKPVNSKGNGKIPEEHSIHGFNHTVLTLDGISRTEELLINELGFEKIAVENNRHRYGIKNDAAGKFIDIINQPNSLPGRMGVGAIHHVAWRTEDDVSQLIFRDRLNRNGYNVTPVMDRNYFHSIYFREPGNVLFEIATDPPGFLIDEPLEELGTHLKLPEWYEKNRSEIEKNLLPLNTKENARI
jgi:glyoxalase family protein